MSQSNSNATSPTPATPVILELDQDKLLEESNEQVKKAAYYMKRALDQNNIRESLKQASLLCSELRTGRLSPKNYYELYMNVTDELRELELYFEEENQKWMDSKEQNGHSVIEFYETVQYCGNVINRLYLLITVASVFLKIPNSPIKLILFDLVELCRGVQQPTRGLFLRNYLSSVTKGVDCEDLNDTINFITINFTEMNKLWVRMQHQGAVRDKTRREKERRNLRQLVGINLVRLSELNGVTVDVYSKTVLPKLSSIIIECKDILSQEYLMDCIIQVFPDTYHLATLQQYLEICTQLTEGVDVKNILIALMDRLSAYALAARESPESAADFRKDIDMFALFHRYSSNVISSCKNMTVLDILQLQVALLRFSNTIYESRFDNVDMIYKFCVETLSRQNTHQVDDHQCIKCIIDLLTLPLPNMKEHILTFPSYGNFLKFLSALNRKQVGISIMKEFVAAKVQLDTAEKVDTLFSYLSPILRDEPGASVAPPQSDDLRSLPLSEDVRFEFEQEQHLLVRLFHFIRHPDTDQQFGLYAAARKWYGQSGVYRIDYTLPALVFACLQLVESIYKREVEAGLDFEEETQKAGFAIRSKKVFGFIHETISVLTPYYAEMALRLFLHAALAADKCAYEPIAYEFVAQAFIAYEDEINDSRAQYHAILQIIGMLTQMNNFTSDNRDTLVSKATQHAAKLLRKTDQCRAVYSCAHLFWTTQVILPEEPNDTNAQNRKDESDEKTAEEADKKDSETKTDVESDATKKVEESNDSNKKESTPSDSSAKTKPPEFVHADAARVLACLQRSLKIANTCVGQQVDLFCEILNKYLWFYDRECPTITVKYLVGLISLIKEHERSLDQSEQAQQSRKFIQNTIQLIQTKASQGLHGYIEVFAGET